MAWAVHAEFSAAEMNAHLIDARQRKAKIAASDEFESAVAGKEVNLPFSVKKTAFTQPVRR